MKISESPLTFLVDSPGVMIPNITKIETGMKLGVLLVYFISKACWMH